MKKFAWLFALALFAPQAALAAAAWLAIAVADNQVSNVDVSSMRREGDMAWLTEIKVFEPLLQGRIRATEADYQIDCRAGAYLYRRIEIVGDDGKVLSSSSTPGEYRTPAPGTIGATILEVGCGRTAVNGGTGATRPELIRRSIAELTGR